jgi:hypothetical protein
LVHPKKTTSFFEKESIKVIKGIKKNSSQTCKQRQHGFSPLLNENFQPQWATCVMKIQWVGKVDIYHEFSRTTHDELSKGIASKPR